MELEDKNDETEFGLDCFNMGNEEEILRPHEEEILKRIYKNREKHRKNFLLDILSTEQNKGFNK